MYKKIFAELDCRCCIVLNYNDKWIINKDKIPELTKKFEENDINNRFDGGIKISVDIPLLKLLIQSVLRYNSFLQFVVIDSKTIISPTDHMDIFVNADNLGEVENHIARKLDPQIFVISR